MSKVHVVESTIAELKEIMEEDFVKLLETFLKDSRQRLVVLQQAIAQNETEELRQVAHGFKGSSGNIGAPHLYDLCHALEKVGRSGLLEGSQDLLEQLREEFEEVEHIMQQYMI